MWTALHGKIQELATYIKNRKYVQNYNFYCANSL